jgi:alpha-tubulin suppressor-like RCC1 family protein
MAGDVCHIPRHMANGVKAGLPLLIAGGIPTLAAGLALGACLSTSDLGSYELSPKEGGTTDAASGSDAEAPSDAQAPRDASADSDATSEASTVVVAPSKAKLSAIATSTCAIAGNGTVKCWGDNTYGTLGNDDMSLMPNPSPLPEPVIGVSKAESLGGGAYVQCAVSATGEPQCWGKCIFGQFSGGSGGGSFATASTSTPYSMDHFGFPANVAQATGGLDYLCMLTRGGAAWCAGTNGSGQLGNNTMTPQITPIEPQATVPLTDLSAAFAGLSTCGVSSVGAVQCWGSNTAGQLGGGSDAGALTPIAVQGLGAGVVVTSVATGDQHACALTSAGAVWCWGDDSQGQLGQVSPSSVPVRVLPSGIQQISAGSTQTCALATSGQVTCWGGGSPTLTTVPGLPPDVAFVSAGTAHACAMRISGAVLCWGDNSFGQLGDGTMNASTTPVQAVGVP